MSQSTIDLFSQLPDGYYINQKALWCGDIRVCIDHIGNNLNAPLDYETAINKMLSMIREKRGVNNGTISN